MSAERWGGLRAQIAQEAARIMYEECVKEYFTAKRIAAKRLLGRVQGRRLRYRPQDLPSNGEIRDALLALAELAEGDRRMDRLFAMRVIGYETMKALLPFEARMIGSVSTGHVRRGSDIDLQVFSDDAEALESHLQALQWVFDKNVAMIQKHGTIREYTHYHVADVFPVELTLYAARELRIRPRSSTDGKPIIRMGIAAVETLLMREHSLRWQQYQRSGDIEGLEEWIHEPDGPAPGPFDGLMADMEPSLGRSMPQARQVEDT
ncbi:MAG: nucleotidyltransferase domain-containing protein [Deltaproteobacteria bacterium]|nr:nucleotidyltransferase domain-containing protein [Deltaproteobacteria bacterium]